jgi:hypothetical protein
MAESARRSGKVVAQEAEKLNAEARLRATRVADDAKRTAHHIERDAKVNLK